MSHDPGQQRHRPSHRLQLATLASSRPPCRRWPLSVRQRPDRERHPADRTGPQELTDCRRRICRQAHRRPHQSADYRQGQRPRAAGASHWRADPSSGRARSAHRQPAATLREAGRLNCGRWCARCRVQALMQYGELETHVGGTPEVHVALSLHFAKWYCPLPPWNHSSRLHRVDCLAIAPVRHIRPFGDW
jgi:hypothetical protein